MEDIATDMYLCICGCHYSTDSDASVYVCIVFITFPATPQMLEMLPKLAELAAGLRKISSVRRMRTM